MRNGNDNMLTRHKIRKVFGGTSKCLAMRMDQELKRTSDECDLPRQELGEEEWATYTLNYAETTMEMRTLGELTGWKEEYWDQHPTTTIWKVDSHQLKENGEKGDRYDSIIPCQFLVSANHLVDQAASIGIFTLPVLEEEIGIHRPDDMKDGPTMRFYMSHGECLIDQDTTKCIREILSREMAIRAGTKERQGLISRVLPHCKISLLPMGSSGHLRRLGHGLAMTHTQELYENAEYRNMIRARRDQNAEFDADTTMEMTDDAENHIKNGTAHAHKTQPTRSWKRTNGKLERAHAPHVSRQKINANTTRTRHDGGNSHQEFV